jgi:type I restriction enzyme S subunit
MTRTINISQAYKVSQQETVPKEWKVRKLGDIFFQLGNFSFSRDQMTDEQQKLSYIHYGDIHLNKEKDSVDLKKDKLPFIFDGLIKKERLVDPAFPYLKNGDIILADASEDYDGIGKSWEIIDTDNHKVISGLHTITLRGHTNEIAVGFGRYLFKNTKSAISLKQVAQGTKVYSISYNHISKLEVLVPPLPEQQKIAEILSAWDKAIDIQTRLIAYLQIRKRALMQQLLTGKKRLKGFSEDWKKVKLGEIGVLFKGVGVPKDKITTSDGYKCLTYGDLYTKYDITITGVKSYIDDITANQSQEIEYGDICFAGSGETKEDIGRCAVFVDDIKGYAGGDIIILRPKGVNPITLSYILNSEYVVRQKSSIGQGHSVVHIYPYQLEQVMIYLPTFKEQNAISEILTTADREIDLAKQKLSYLRTQKQGLMQQLLTGKKRVR